MVENNSVYGSDEEADEVGSDEKLSDDGDKQLYEEVWVGFVRNFS